MPDSLDFVTAGGLFCFLNMDAQGTIVAVLSSSQAADVAVVLASEREQCYIVQSHTAKGIWVLNFGCSGSIYMCREDALEIADSFRVQTIGMIRGNRARRHRGKGKPDAPTNGPAEPV